MASPDSTIEELLGTSRTTRCANAYFRQKQLKSLHDVLRHKIVDIRLAIKQDTGVTDAEITTEIAAVLNIIKEHYAGIDPKKELDEEYRVTKRKDAGDRKIVYGVVYIEPLLRHTPFFNIVAPLCVALAAGNCVALRLDRTTQLLQSLLRTLLPQALEQDTFQFIASSPTPETINQCLSVFQDTKATETQPNYSQLVSSRGKAIAIVDRTADLSAAADHLVRARFAFGGTSPYAPDLVLVNEFVSQKFTEHVVEHAKRFISTTKPPSGLNEGPPQTHSRAASNVRDDIMAIEKDGVWKVHVVSHGLNGFIGNLSCSSKTLAPLPPKVSTPLFCIFSITSLDHAVDLISSDSDERLLAAYHFAAPAHTKYLSQFIKAEISFANYIPASLLLGPAGPVSHELDVISRYRKDQFVLHSPVFVAGSKSVISAGDSSKDADRLLREATKEIRAKKRAEWMSIGFFEQGILLGLGVYGVPILTCLGASIFFGVRLGIRKWASS